MHAHLPRAELHHMPSTQLAPAPQLGFAVHAHLDRTRLVVRLRADPGDHSFDFTDIAVWLEANFRFIQANAGGILVATPFLVVDVSDPDQTATAIRWWEELTAQGGEGTVVKPLDFIARGKRGLIQPAVKCRGREYLRIIYGPDYTAPENLDRLRSRGLHAKRSLALREFALGVESLERFIRHEPLRKVHECVFGVLAMESEPVDPRL